MRKTGLSGPTLRQIVSTGGSLGRDVAGTLFQTFGRQLQMDADWHLFKSQAGLNDLDASVTVRDKLASILNDEGIGPVTKAARVVRAALNTGLGRGEFDTLKPLSIFTQLSKWGHTASAWGLAKNVESLLARAVRHFETASGSIDLTEYTLHDLPHLLGIFTRMIGPVPPPPT